MLLQSSGMTYQWQGNWAGLNSTEGSSHHDIAIDSQGREGDFGGRFIYCFNSDLALQFRLDGSEYPCGPHSEPHWIFADRRKGYTEIYVADRENHRLVVYDANGNFQRVVEGGFNTPSSFGSFGEYLVVPELKGRLHILNADDQIMATFADGSAYAKE